MFVCVCVHVCVPESEPVLRFIFCSAPDRIPDDVARQLLNTTAAKSAVPAMELLPGVCVPCVCACVLCVLACVCVCVAVVCVYARVCVPV